MSCRQALFCWRPVLARGSAADKKSNFLSYPENPSFLKSLKSFSLIPSIKEIVLVVPPQSKNVFKKWVKNSRTSKVSTFVPGGRFRGESVKKGIQSLSNRCRVVLIHDAARPLVEGRVIKRVERAAQKFGVALAAWPLPDTLKRVSRSGCVSQTVPRKNLWLAQTPQGFQMKIAKRCLLHPSRTATDDVELAQRKGYSVKVVEGDPKNFKVTYPYDLKICRALVGAGSHAGPRVRPDKKSKRE